MPVCYLPKYFHSNFTIIYISRPILDKITFPFSSDPYYLNYYKALSTVYICSFVLLFFILYFTFICSSHYMYYILILEMLETIE